MFGLLPRTRSIFKGNAVAFRLDRAQRAAQTLLTKDSRIAAFDKDKTRWFAFQILCDTDLHDALDVLGRTFDAAGNRRKSR